MKRLLLLSLMLACLAPLAHAQDARPDEPDTLADRQIRLITPEGDVTIRINPGGEIVVEQGGSSTVLRMEPGWAEDLRLGLDGELERFKEEHARIAPRVRAFFAPGDSSRVRGFKAFGPDRDFFLDGPLGMLKGPWMGEDHREVMEMERAAHELARQARRAEGAERARLERELQDKLNQIFDKKQELRRERVTELEQQLREEQARLDERSRTRDEIVERRQRELLGEPDRLDW